MLNLPDFRSSERTFDLLTQVAGRTGRGYHPGNVIIQTYSPENYAIMAAAEHDFPTFYKKEMEERGKLKFPPFTSLIKLSYSSKIAEKAEKEATELSLKIEEKIPGVTVLGPSPAFLAKIGGKYRWQIVLKTSNTEGKIKEILEKLRPFLKKDWAVDVNPESLL
jgi:primosomal protein N' (replication factor Y)